MLLKGFPTGVTDWSMVPGSVYPGEMGVAKSAVRHFRDIQLRVVVYSQGYVGEHWCKKGHIVFVVSGYIAIEHSDGQRYEVGPGSSYHVADNAEASHRVSANAGATVFIVD